MRFQDASVFSEGELCVRSVRLPEYRSEHGGEACTEVLVHNLCVPTLGAFAAGQLFGLRLSCLPGASPSGQLRGRGLLEGCGFAVSG